MALSTAYLYYKGTGLEIYEPRFSYHAGRYMLLEGYPAQPSLDAVEGIWVRTDMKQTGDFACSNEMINKLQSALKWTIGSLVHGYPQDCPYREKNGWTGDVNLSAEQVLMNFDPSLDDEKWLEDLKDAQRPSGQLPGIIPTSGWGLIGGAVLHGIVQLYSYLGIYICTVEM